MYFKMIVKFANRFKLTTIVNKDGSIDIAGIDEEFNDVFRFKLNEDQQIKLLGLTNSIKDQTEAEQSEKITQVMSHMEKQRQIAKNKEEIEKSRPRNKFVVIGSLEEGEKDNGEDDFSDITSMRSQALSDMTGGLQSVFEGRAIDETKKKKKKKRNDSSDSSSSDSSSSFDCETPRMGAQPPKLRDIDARTAPLS